MSIQLTWPTLVSVAFKLVTVRGMVSKSPVTPEFCDEMTKLAFSAALVSKFLPLIPP